MTRRDSVALLSGAAAWPLAAHAQLLRCWEMGFRTAPPSVTAHGTTGVSTPWPILDAALTVISTS
jgi:hypothetical protein